MRCVRVSLGVTGAEGALLRIVVTSGAVTDVRAVHPLKASAQIRAHGHSEHAAVGWAVCRTR